MAHLFWKKQFIILSKGNIIVGKLIFEFMDKRNIKNLEEFCKSFKAIRKGQASQK